MTEKMQTKAGDAQTESVKASDQITENGSDKAAVTISGPTLTEMIADDLRQKKNILACL